VTAQTRKNPRPVTEYVKSFLENNYWKLIYLPSVVFKDIFPETAPTPLLRVLDVVLEDTVDHSVEADNNAIRYISWSHLLE
jgi:hypothetical protein